MSGWISFGAFLFLLGCFCDFRRHEAGQQLPWNGRICVSRVEAGVCGAWPQLRMSVFLIYSTLHTRVFLLFPFSISISDSQEQVFFLLLRLRRRSCFSVIVPPICIPFSYLLYLPPDGFLCAFGLVFFPELLLCLHIDMNAMSTRT